MARGFGYWGLCVYILAVHERLLFINSNNTFPHDVDSILVDMESKLMGQYDIIDLLNKNNGKKFLPKEICKALGISGHAVAKKCADLARLNIISQERARDAHPRAYRYFTVKNK